MMNKLEYWRNDNVPILLPAAVYYLLRIDEGIYFPVYRNERRFETKLQHAPVSIPLKLF